MREVHITVQLESNVEIESIKQIVEGSVKALASTLGPPDPSKSIPLATIDIFEVQKTPSFHGNLDTDPGSQWHD